MPHLETYQWPRGVLQFALNASTDTLPTLVNLQRWHIRSNNSKCPLCQNSQTLLHVLNFCKPMLEQGRYTWRHDSILSYISSLFKHPIDNAKVYTDLGSSSKESVATIPPDVIPTSQRPDLVIYWPNLKKICIFELTVPFDTNIQKAHERKSNKYASLVLDLEDRDFEVLFFCVVLFPLKIAGPLNHWLNFPAQRNRSRQSVTTWFRLLFAHPLASIALNLTQLGWNHPFLKFKN